MSVGTLRLGSFLLHVVLYDVYVVGREGRYLEAGIFSFSEVPTTHTPFSSQRGGACRKVFDHIHEYSLNKKWLNLRASGLPKWGGACQKVFDHIHDYSFNKKWINLRATGLSCLGCGQNKYGGYPKKI